MSLEESPVNDPQSNGGVERAVRSMKEMVRTLKSDLESKSKTELKMDNPIDRCILAWLAEYAGTLLRRFTVRPDGSTPYQAVKGRKSRRCIVPFFEKIWWKPLRTDGRSNIDARVEEGYYIGIRDSSDEAIIATPNGLTKCRDLTRRTWSERWNLESLGQFRCTPSLENSES